MTSASCLPQNASTSTHVKQRRIPAASGSRTRGAPQKKGGDDFTVSTSKTPISNRGFVAQFVGTIPYHDPLILDEVIASVDSVRLKFVYRKTGYDFDKCRRFDTLDQQLFELTSEKLFMDGLFDIGVSRECGFRIGNYMRTVTYTLPDGNSFAVLVGRFSFNANVKMVEPEIIMDFNPNKVDRFAWRRIFDILRIGAQKISVQRYDLAIDIPTVRKSLHLEQRPGSGYEKFVSKSGAITEYTGERSHHAAVKLYDKGADLGVDLVCTRLEITIDPAKFKGIKKLLPVISSMAPVELSMDFWNLPFEVKAVILHPDLYDVLKASVSRNTFPKYKQMISDYGQTYFAIDDSVCSKIDNFLRDYFINLTAKSGEYTT